MTTAMLALVYILAGLAAAPFIGALLADIRRSQTRPMARQIRDTEFERRVQEWERNKMRLSVWLAKSSRP